MKNGISIALEVDSTKMQRQLRAIAKHTEALADELRDIEREVCRNCGSQDVEVTKAYGDAQGVIETVIDCKACGSTSYPTEGE